MDSFNNVFNTLQVDTHVRNILSQSQGTQNQNLFPLSQEGEQDTNYYDIVTLEEINFSEDWDYSLPTIYSNVTPILKNKRIKDINKFQERFNDIYADYFSQVDFNNILIAGGSVIGILLQEDWNNDVDIFIYGLSEEQAIQKVNTLINQMYKSYQDAIMQKHHYNEEINEEVDTENIQRIGHFENINRASRIRTKQRKTLPKKSEIEIISIRNKNAITLQFDSKREIQIILRLYRSISEILHGFDMGSVAMGYDGINVYFTSLGKFSYENLANIVDPTRRSTTYEHRLYKYLQRGFHIILPYLDINKLKTSNLKYGIAEVASLPYFTFAYRNIKGNKITFDGLLEWGPKQTKFVPVERAKRQSASALSLPKHINKKLVESYCSTDIDKSQNNRYSDYQENNLSEYEIFYLNLRALVRSDNTCGYYHYNTHMNLDILTSRPYISPSRIIDYYDSLAKRIYNKSTFNIGIFSAYFSVELLPHVLTDIFLNNTGSSKLDELIELQKTHVLNKLSSLNPNDYSLRFLTKNPGTQLTGSFNPIISNVEDWYGNYAVHGY